MKIYKISLRILIATSSVAGFLGGWALLAHAPKPMPPSQQPALVELVPLPTLAPIPSFSERNRGLEQLPALPQIEISRPRLMTGGS